MLSPKATCHLIRDIRLLAPGYCWNSLWGGISKSAIQLQERLYAVMKAGRDRRVIDHTLAERRADIYFVRFGD